MSDVHVVSKDFSFGSLASFEEYNQGRKRAPKRPVSQSPIADF
jgi:hypothetical protein